MVKRVFDVVMAAIGLLVLSPLLIVVMLLVKLESRGPVFFRQERVGRGFRPFGIYKFRTMVRQASRDGVGIAVSDDGKITRIGHILRQSKIDELPQLINVLKGDMSLVGPRPELPQYVELVRHDYEGILTVRPGITDLASLRYRDEPALLRRSRNPQEEYVTRILPEKTRLAKEYLKQSSFLFDLMLIARTLLRLFGVRSAS